jgi:hypothetical protein
VPEGGPRALVEGFRLLVELGGGEADELEQATHAVRHRLPEALRVAHRRVPDADVLGVRKPDVDPVLHHDIRRRRLRHIVVDDFRIGVLVLQARHDGRIVRLGQLDGTPGQL